MPVEGLFNTTIDLLGKSVDLRTRNQNLISSNIANAETPGYTPKKLEFEQQLQSAVKKSSSRGMHSAGSSATTHPAHIPLRGGGGERISQVRGTVVETPAKNFLSVAFINSSSNLASIRISKDLIAMRGAFR